MSKKIIIKTQDQIDNIRQAGKYLNELLYLLKDMSKEGVILYDLENYAESYLKKNYVKGAFKGYMGYPANLCLSVNDCVVHGIPNEYVLRTGDLLKIDLGVEYKKGIADAAVSVVVGGDNANPRAAKLIKATKDGLDISIKEIADGNSIYSFSQKIYEYINSKGFSIIKNLTGHGVGVDVHEGPYIYNRPFEEAKFTFFKKGMVVAIEPITAESSYKAVERTNNGWNLFTLERDLGAQWEYTIVIKDEGYEILAGLE